MRNYNIEDRQTSQGVRNVGRRNFLRGASAAAGGLLVSSFLTGCEPIVSEEDNGYNFGDNNPDLVLALGDSITASGYPAKLEEMIEKDVINKGFCGRTSEYGAGRITDLLGTYKPGHLLVMFGTNDVRDGISLERSKEYLRTIIQAAENNKTRAVIGTVIPHPTRGAEIVVFNEMVEALADEEGMRLADVYSAFGWYNPALYLPGETHPNESGSTVIAGCFADAL